MLPNHGDCPAQEFLVQLGDFAGDDNAAPAAPDFLDILKRLLNAMRRLIEDQRQRLAFRHTFG